MGDLLSYDLGLLLAVFYLAIVDAIPELAGDIFGPGDLLVVDDHSRTIAAAAAAIEVAVVVARLDEPGPRGGARRPAGYIEG